MPLTIYTQGHLKTARVMPRRSAYIQRRIIAAYYIALRRERSSAAARMAHYYSQVIDGLDARQRLSQMNPEHTRGLDYTCRKKPRPAQPLPLFNGA